MLELDPELMGLVFYNLLLNAAQASPKGGPITIKTRLTDSNAEISVIDRGSGVSPQTRRAFSTPSSRRSLMASDWDSPIVSKIVDETWRQDLCREHREAGQRISRLSARAPHAAV